MRRKRAELRADEAPAVDAPVRIPIVRARRSSPVFVIAHANTDCQTIVAAKPKPTRASTIHQPEPGQTKRTLDADMSIPPATMTRDRPTRRDRSSVGIAASSDPAG